MLWATQGFPLQKISRYIAGELACRKFQYPEMQKTGQIYKYNFKLQTTKMYGAVYSEKRPERMSASLLN